MVLPRSVRSWSRPNLSAGRFLTARDRHAVAMRFNTFLEDTQADGLIVVTNTYEFEDRLRSYEWLANLAKQRREVQVHRSVEA